MEFSRNLAIFSKSGIIETYKDAAVRHRPAPTHPKMVEGARLMRRTSRSILLALVIGAAFQVAPAWAVVLGNGGNGNTTPLSLENAGGPLTTDPGFLNIGRSGTGNASVTYLSNGWGITAGHVTMDATFNQVTLGPNQYTVDLNSITYLHNPDNSLADLKLFHLTTTPAIPSITPNLISAVSPPGLVVMIGNGLSITSGQQFWQVDKTNPNNWIWQSVGSQPASPGPDDYSGYNVGGSTTVRWGDNQVIANNVFVHTADGPLSQPMFVNGFVTQLDNMAYTGNSPLADEAQATPGDSGGGVFSYANSHWELSGITIAINDPRNNQPGSTALFGDQTLIADLSIYRDQIVAIVPEPTSTTLILAAAATLAIFWRRTKR